MTTPKLPPPPRSAQKRSALLLLAGGDEAAVGEDDVGLEQVVDGQSELAGEMADAAAEGDAADAGGGDDAAGRGQAEGVGGMVEIAQHGAGLDAGGARHRIDADAVHRREVDHQPVVDGAQAGAVVAAAADGDGDAVLAGEVDGGDDVGHVGAADDERRMAVDHRVVDHAGVVVAGVAGLDQLAAQRGDQALHCRFGDDGEAGIVVVAMVNLLCWHVEGE